MVRVDNKFSKLFKTYLGKDAVYNFINKTLKKVNINKEVEMIKEDNEDFKNPTKWWIYRNYYVDVDIKVRDHCHINGKYRGSAHRDRNINLRLNYKIPVIFHNLKNHDSHLIMQELGKFNFKINVIPNGLEKYMSFTINNKLSFIDSFQFLSSSLDSLNKDDFKYLGPKFDNNVVDLVQQKWLYHYKYISEFEKFNEELPSQKKFYTSLTDRKIGDKEYEQSLNVWEKN